MEPKIVLMDRLCILGLTGNGSETGKVWGDFEEIYDKRPFQKKDEYGYEIRFYDGEEKATSKMDIHVGFSSMNEEETEGFSIIVLPETEYAVFDVFVAKGYDSENKNMNKWLSDNADKFTQLQHEGKKFVVECYNEKFKGGDKPDSIVEIWIPIKRNN